MHNHKNWSQTEILMFKTNVLGKGLKHIIIASAWLNKYNSFKLLLIKNVVNKYMGARGKQQ